MKNIEMELSEETIAEVEEALSVYGLNVETVVSMFLSRIAKEKSIGFLFDKREFSNPENKRERKQRK